MVVNKKDTPVADQKNWYGDRYEFVTIQRNILAATTLFALMLAMTATFSIYHLAPLKSVEPFVIQVDQKSGVTQVVNPLTARELLANESINQYFIVQYCRARESYISSDRNFFDYNLVRVFSDRPTFGQYQQEVGASGNDNFHQRIVTAGGSRDIHIESIKYLDRRKDSTGSDVLRYLIKAKITERIGSTPKVMQKLILIEFRYVELELTTEDRYLNPIGFQVVSYRVDEDNYTQ